MPPEGYVRPWPEPKVVWAMLREMLARLEDDEPVSMSVH